jgi:hemoglobin
MTTPTVNESARGVDAFRRLTEVFYDKVLEDPLLAPVFAHMSDKHREHVAIWLSEVFGGPKNYTDELG